MQIFLTLVCTMMNANPLHSANLMQDKAHWNLVTPTKVQKKKKKGEKVKLTEHKIAKEERKGIFQKIKLLAKCGDKNVETIIQ